MGGTERKDMFFPEQEKQANWKETVILFPPVRMAVVEGIVTKFLKRYLGEYVEGMTVEEAHGNNVRL